jgi:hypothetical protein
VSCSAINPKKKKIKEDINPSKAPLLTPCPRRIIGIPHANDSKNEIIDTGKNIFIGLNKKIMFMISIIVSNAV